MPSDHQLTCREFIEFLASYIDGTLPAERRQTFDDHLALCPDCVAYLDSYKKTIAITKQAFADDTEIPDEAPEDLIEAILVARRSRP